MVAAAKLTGMTFGRITVVGRAESSAVGKTRWNCVCKCGNKPIVNGYALTSGTTKSCGCFQRDVLREIRTKHGGASGRRRSKEYRAWIQMRRRCFDERAASFGRYGAVGISVVPEWVDDFEAFLNHIGPSPSEKHSVDRIDNNRGYEPGNVRWATAKQQCRNKRKNIYTQFNGTRMLLVEACEATGIVYYVAYQRTKRGLALTQ